MKHCCFFSLQTWVICKNGKRARGVSTPSFKEVLGLSRWSIAVSFHCKLGWFARMGSQHPSPNVKNLCTFELQIWLEIITSRDAKSTCFKGSQTSCTEIISGVFWPKFGRKRSHRVMDAACWKKLMRHPSGPGETARFVSVHPLLQSPNPKDSKYKNNVGVLDPRENRG